MSVTTIKLPPQPWMASGSSLAIFEIISQAGGEARFVGGCVRDALLERPVTDIDIACTHTPEKTMELLEAEGIRTFPTGLAHGTITAVCDDKESIQRYEITTLRRDVACDGRHAEVAFTTNWEEDASRRDFTMNALYAIPDGTVYDYFGGVEDARHGRVIFIGDPLQRIEEDALRILRFFRFFAHYGTLPMDEAGLAACAQMAGRLEQLSGERVQSEMLKILSSEHPADVLGVMQEHGLLQPIGLPFSPNVLAVLDLLPQNEMDAGQKINPLCRLALILRKAPHAIDAARNLAKQWKLSNNHANHLQALVSSSLDGMGEWHQSVYKRTIRRVGGKAFAQMALIAWTEYLAAHADKQREARAAFGPLGSFAENWVSPEFPVRGRDLKPLGIAEGPQMGRMLAALEAYWENNDYQPDKPTLLEQAREWLDNGQLPGS